MTNASELQGPRPTPSVAEHLRKSFREAQAEKTKDFKIPGYDGLFVTFRALDDYTEVREVLKDAVNRRGVPAAEREIEIGARTLLAASVSSHAVIDGQQFEIGLPLGTELYDYINPPEPDESPEGRPQTDVQATVMLFPSTLSLMLVSTQLDRWSRGEAADTDEELLGES